MLQDGIQEVLLALTLNLSSKMKAPDACRAMAGYCFFVNLLLKDFKTGLCGGTEFILQTILHTLLSTLVRQISSCLQCHCIDSAVFSYIITIMYGYNAGDISLCDIMSAVSVCV